jgi:hypothetical protein
MIHDVALAERAVAVGVRAPEPVPTNPMMIAAAEAQVIPASLQMNRLRRIFMITALSRD